MVHMEVMRKQWTGIGTRVAFLFQIYIFLAVSIEIKQHRTTQRTLYGSCPEIMKRSDLHIL